MAGTGFVKPGDLGGSLADVAPCEAIKPLIYEFELYPPDIAGNKLYVRLF